MDKEEILKEIYEATDPHEMNKQEARDFLQDIIDNLETMVEALDQEIEEDEG